MRLNFPVYVLLVSTVLLGLAQQSAAGNKWMMEKNANELIMLNSALLKQLGTSLKDGEITLSGDVIHENGKVIIKLYKLQQIKTSPDDTTLSSEVFDKDLPYHIFLREETLAEIPVTDQVNDEQQAKRNTTYQKDTQ